VADWNPRANELFLRAAEIAAPAERAAFLDRECGDDAIRRNVDALLAADAKAGSFLNEPAGGRPNGTVAFEPIAEAPGTVIGPYKLLQQIGEGGFGVVYMAEQERPVRRMVALKIIKPGMDSSQVIARFESERQALALMDHPNIAKVLDAGATDAGRPYFVMELVKGVPITEFCDKNHMPAEGRLKLFIDVCHAIQHAHHKSVIHRDIKPSNVMVTLHDGVPVVKVIDFGVAKATVQRLTEKTLFTAYGQMIGTPAYMSPEQAEMSGLDIDTRSDVYSLGVLLYELLTGTTPLDMNQLREAGYMEMQRLIREEEAPRPSTRMSSLGDSATVLAGNRGLEVKKLAQLLAGDLDWVVMKALDKDRNRRYGTPGNFAEDIERYLNREAILARPPSTIYRLRKFTQRNRAAALTGATVAAALLIGATAATWQAVRATRAESAARAALIEAEAARAAEAGERVRAEGNERKALASAVAEKTAKESALQREAEIKAVLDFVESRVFAAARPEGQEGGLGQAVTLRRAVEVALPFVHVTFADQPLIEAQLRLTLAKSFYFLGEVKIAADECEAARALYSKHLGHDDPLTLTAANLLALAYAGLGRSGDALKLREETLALRTTKLGPDHPDTFKSMINLAVSYEELGRFADALGLREQTLRRAKTILGPDHPLTLASMQGLASTYMELGRNAEALGLNEQALALRKAKLGLQHPDTLVSMNGLAINYYNLGRHADALKLREETLAIYKVNLGPMHPDTLISMNNLSNSYLAIGRFDEAARLYEETLALTKAKFGPDHPHTLMSMMNMAIGYAGVGRHADAVKLGEETLALEKAKHGPEHPETLRDMVNLANLYSDLRRPRDALKLQTEALALMKAKLGADHPNTLWCTTNVAKSYAELGRHADAIQLLEETLPRQVAKLGPDHRSTLVIKINLAFAYAAVGRHADALKLREGLLAVTKARFGPDHFDTLGCMYNLADSYAALGRNADALPLREGIWATRKASLGPDDPKTLISMRIVASTFADLDRHAEAAKLFEQALALGEAKLGVDHADTRKTKLNLAVCYDALDRHADALKLFEETLALQKSAVPPDNAGAVLTTWGLARTLMAVDRSADAVRMIDECLTLAGGAAAHEQMILNVMDLRLRHFEKAKDAAGCRQTAEMWEKLNRRDSDSLYNAACNRAITAAAVKQDATTPGGDVARLSGLEADRAMAWLTQAVAAGYKDAAHVKQDKDLDALRDREDFRKLLAGLEAGPAKPN
jgi:serine/threonine protein kinase/tetratricopeptide (TPR) repeat protein